MDDRAVEVDQIGNMIIGRKEKRIIPVCPAGFPGNDALALVARETIEMHERLRVITRLKVLRLDPHAGKTPQGAGVEVVERRFVKHADSQRQQINGKRRQDSGAQVALSHGFYYREVSCPQQ